MLNKFDVARDIRDYILLLIGTFILALGIYWFLEPNTIAPGGVTGLAIVIKKITGVEVAITNLIINVPLFILGLVVLGKAFGFKTALGTLFLSIYLMILNKFGLEIALTDDLLLASIFGGICSGLGIGMVFRSGGTTGGTDLAGAILHNYFPSLSIAKLMMILDLFVIVTAGIVDKNIETSLYSMIALYTIVKVADFIVEGLDYSKSFQIVTDHPDEIGKALLENLDRGVTSLYGKGMYSGKDKQVLLCVVHRGQVAKAKKIIYDIDHRAFIMVTTTHEVLGEGFRESK